MSAKNRQKTNPLASLHDKRAQQSLLQKKASKALLDSESEGDSGSDSGSGSSGSGSTRRTPHSQETTSYLSEETKKMSNQRREIEQKGERQFARVNAKEHSDDELQHAAGDDLQNEMMQHPWFQGQRFDGIDDNTPEPALNSLARKDFDNARREQEMEKQLRLGLAPGPKFSSTPKPPMG